MSQSDRLQSAGKNPGRDSRLSRQDSSRGKRLQNRRHSYVSATASVDRQKSRDSKSRRTGRDREKRLTITCSANVTCSALTCIRPLALPLSLYLFLGPFTVLIIRRSTDRPHLYGWKNYCIRRHRFTLHVRGRVTSPRGRRRRPLSIPFAGYARSFYAGYKENRMVAAGLCPRLHGVMQKRVKNLWVISN